MSFIKNDKDFQKKLELYLENNLDLKVDEPTKSVGVWAYTMELVRAEKKKKDLVQKYIDNVGYVDIKDYGNIDLLEDLVDMVKFNNYNAACITQPSRFTEGEIYSEILRRMRKSFPIDVSQ